MKVYFDSFVEDLSQLIKRMNYPFNREIRWEALLAIMTFNWKIEKDRSLMIHFFLLRGGKEIMSLLTKYRKERYRSSIMPVAENNNK